MKPQCSGSQSDPDHLVRGVKRALVTCPLSPWPPGTCRGTQSLPGVRAAGSRSLIGGSSSLLWVVFRPNLLPGQVRDASLGEFVARGLSLLFPGDSPTVTTQTRSSLWVTNNSRVTKSLKYSMDKNSELEKLSPKCVKKCVKTF